MTGLGPMPKLVDLVLTLEAMSYLKSVMLEGGCYLKRAAVANLHDLR